MQIEITSSGVEIRLFDGNADLAYEIIINPFDTAKAQLLAEILEGSHVDVIQCQY